MSTDGPATPADLERFRPYLRLIARLHLPAALRGKLEPSDVVQDTLVKALRHLDQYRGRTEAELAGWLRQTLATTLANATRDWGRGKRDAGREVPLEREVHDSSARLEAVLVADQTSPSLAASRHEDLLRLAAALEALPDAQREAVTLYHLRQVPLDRIAARLDRTPAAVAGLIKRGLKQVRAALVAPDPTGSNSGRPK
jgi:RNA polymerase sigma-70 factor (ECF subfamily)